MGCFSTLFNPVQVTQLQIIMNTWDRDNLTFILGTTDEGFDIWLEQADQDDIAYALELIYKAKSEYIIEDPLDSENIIDFSEANKLIDRIKNV